MSMTRRSVLTSVSAAAALGLAGCLDSDGGGSVDPSTIEVVGEGTLNTSATAPLPVPEPPDIEGAPPVTTDRPGLAYDLETLEDAAVSGGVSQDGIPSIDTPVFVEAGDADIDPDSIVFGVELDGTARAYPQSILVWHEIVNDRIGDYSIAVTYCPLTGTAQGFERGDAAFGVSGMLVNSNLIMYDRTTDSWYPQVLGTGITGPMAGLQLREFRVLWTTWERWRSRYPETELLTEQTGFIRDYTYDPYGSQGYYTGDWLTFPSLLEDDRAHRKEVVLGTRTPDGAIAYNMERLQAELVLQGAIGDTAYVAVADQGLATGYVYANPSQVEIVPEGDQYLIDGVRYRSDELPLERSLSFDAMWFAWAGYYPHTAYVDGNTDAG